MKTNEFKNANFINDEEKMRDFKVLSKEEFLASYSYLTEKEYDNTYNKYYAMKNEYHWIPVKEALPEEDKSVLLTYLAYPDYQTPTVDNSFGYLHKGEWYWVEENEDNCRQKIKVPVTAWMAVTPYEENNKNNNKSINSKEEETMRILLKEDVKAKLDENGWSAYENEMDVDFSTCSAFGGDINIVIDKGNNLTDLAHNIYEYWNNYDVSYETSLWIGEDGHGINGAPYDLKDIYEDMEGVKNMIEELYFAINEEVEKEEKQAMSKHTLKDELLELRTTLEKAKQRLIELKEEVGDSIGTSEVVTKDDLLVDDLEKHLEKLEEHAEMSQEHCDFLEGLNNISASRLKQIVDSYEVLLNYYKENFPWRKGATAVEEFETDLKPLSDFIGKITTNKHCPKCGELLLKSDLPQYEYVCSLCDENFYDCEVK